MRFFAGLAAFVAVSAGATACLFDPGVPADALVTCKSSAECPSEKICNTESHLCVAAVGGTDGVAPTLKAVTIDPPAGKAGSTFTVNIVASEALLIVPELKVNTGNGDVALTLGAHDALQSAAPSFTYTYRVQGPGHEREGEAQLVATLVDVSGNAADGLVAGSLRFDFTPPAIVEGSVSALLAPGADNPLADVGAVTNGTRATLLMTVTEPVQDGATLTTTPSTGAAWTWELVSQRDTTFIFAHTFAAGDVDDGPLAATLAVTDLAGNAASIDVPFSSPLVVDTRAPAAPPTSTPGAVVYTRAPWGTAANAAPAWHVHGDGLDADAVLVAALAENGGAVIAHATVNAGSFDLDLPPGDRPRIDVVAVDAAGNASARAPIHDVTFVAGLNGKVAGSVVENPHALLAFPTVTGAAVPVGGAGARELGDGDGVGVVDGNVASVAGGVTFQSVPPEVARPVANLVAAFDPLALAPVAFDGQQAQTFTFNGLAWHALGNGVRAPDVRTEAAMAYDVARGRAVLFGGEGDVSGVPLDDVWEYDDLTGWQLVPSVDGSTPGARFRAAFADDEARGVAVLLGGAGRGDADGATAATWTWDGARWTHVTTADPEGDGDPKTRDGARAVFHRARGVVVLVGGEGLDGSNCDTTHACVDTWTWNGTSWRNVTVATSQPPPRVDASLAYDDARAKVVLFGGRDPDTGVLLDDTWEWDGTWTRTAAGGAGQPGARVEPIFVEGASGVVLAGGDDDVHTFQDTWRYDGAWHLVTPESAQPDDVFNPAALTSSPDGGLLLVNPNHGSAQTETWQRTSGIWSLVTTSGPPARDNASVVFDPARNVVVLVGGLSLDATHAFNDTWEYAGGGAWTQTFADAVNVATQPSERRGATVAFDANTNTVELLGGFDVNGVLLDDAWSYDGTWTEHPANQARPTPRAFASAAFDPNLGGVVLYGGLDQNDLPLGDTWLKDATGWHAINPSQSPPIRAGAAAVFVAALGGVTLFGGQGADAPLAQTWVLRNNAWTMLTHADRDGDGEPDAAAPWGQAALDTQTGDVVLLVDDALFTLHGPDSRPAALFRMNAKAALAKPGSVTTALAVEANTGAVSSTGQGALAFVWDGRAFVEIGHNGATAQAPAALSVSAPSTLFHAIDAAAASRDGVVPVALSPNGPTGSVDASIAIDAVDVAWSYREP